MAKQVKVFKLTEVATGKTIEVRVKTTTEKFLNKLIKDYYNLGKFDSTNVAVTPA